jgi:hypothetical protein
MSDAQLPLLTGPERIERIQALLEELNALEPTAAEMRLVMEMAGGTEIEGDEIDQIVDETMTRLKEAR